MVIPNFFLKFYQVPDNVKLVYKEKIFLFSLKTIKTIATNVISINIIMQRNLKPHKKLKIYITSLRI